MTNRRNPTEGSIIYVMIMPMPQLDKNHILLGITHDVMEREKTHNQYNTYPVECIYAREIKGSTGTAYKIEQALLVLLHPYRIRTKSDNPTETLWVNAPDGPNEQDIIDIIKLFPGTDIDLSSPDDDTAKSRQLAREVQQERGRREHFRFHLVEITPGSELTFKYDADITCKVIDDRMVKYDRESMPLSRAARFAMEKTGRGNSSGSYQGTQYWNYNGRLIEAIRNEIEDREIDSNDSQ